MTQDDLTAVLAGAAAVQSFFDCYLVKGSISLQDLTDAGEVTTVSGETLTITSEDEGIVMVNDKVQIVSLNATTNSYIFLVNNLIWPLMKSNPQFALS